MLNHESYLKCRYFPGLDALRGFAILLVLFHHSSLSVGFLSPLHANGVYGVHLFFIISGFIIATQLLRSSALTLTSLSHFFLRRFLRLAPLYYLALGVEAFLVFELDMYSQENRSLFRDKLPAYAFYFSNWHPAATKGPFFQAWSLAVEGQFYLLFGLAAFLFPLKLWSRLCAFAVIAKVVLFSSGLIPWTAPWWRVLFSFQESLLIGVLLAVLLQKKVFFVFAASLTRARHVVGMASLFAILLLSVSILPHSSRADALTLYLVFALIVLASVLRPSLYVFSSSIMIGLGKISYGIYLFHMFFVNFAKVTFPDYPWAAFLISTALSVLSASILFRLIEQPVQALYKRRFSDARSVSTPVLVNSEMSPSPP